jgi:anhydro-N-acetylmuramic acid kinase
MKKLNSEPIVLLGLMSGTSCDGLDLVVVQFDENPNDGYSWHVLAAKTQAWPEAFRKRLQSAAQLDLHELMLLDKDLGTLMGKWARQFLEDNTLPPVTAISSHGHTVLHRPAMGYTLQIGSGAHLREAGGLPVICNFRQQDVAKGGQGAPLVPVGDALLFSGYEACLNLGGFSNISLRKDGQVHAFDICPVNIVLNALAERLGYTYDPEGQLAKSGTVLPELLKQLNALDFYRQSGPRSLGKEWVDAHVWSLMNAMPHATPQDLLATWTLHAGQQIGAILTAFKVKNLLVTGGGAYNDTLWQVMTGEAPDCRLVKPDPLVVDFKEAIVFAFLGYLYLLGRQNVWASVTGAKTDHCAGIYFG